MFVFAIDTSLCFRIGRIMRIQACILLLGCLHCVVGASVIAVHVRGIATITQQGPRKHTAIATSNKRCHGICRLVGGAPEVDYCPECAVPTEYCFYIARCPTGDQLRKAKNPASKISDAGPAAVLAVNADGTDLPDLSKLTLKKGVTSNTTLVKEPSRGKQKGVAKKKQITIKVDKRGSRKHVTSVAGMDLFMGEGSTLKDTAKLLAKQLAASASVVKGIPGNPDAEQIVVQGNRAEEIAEFCISNLGASPGVIVTTGNAEEKK